MKPTTPSLSYFRRKAGMSQSVLAGVVGLTAMSISNYESGRNNPSIESLVRIASALDVSVDQLLSDPPINPRD